MNKRFLNKNPSWKKSIHFPFYGLLFNLKNKCVASIWLKDNKWKTTIQNLDLHLIFGKRYQAKRFIEHLVNLIINIFPYYNFLDVLSVKDILNYFDNDELASFNKENIKTISLLVDCSCRLCSFNILPNFSYCQKEIKEFKLDMNIWQINKNIEKNCLISKLNQLRNLLK